MSINTDIAPRKSIDEILVQRERAIADFEKGIKLLVSAQKQMSQGGFGCFVMANTFTDRHLSYCIEDKNTAGDLTKQFTRALDKNLWQHLVQISGLWELMDETARTEWKNGLEKKDMPPCTLENIESTMGQLHSQRKMIFNRGLVKAFQGLSGKYKTNDAFKLGKKVIVTYATNYRTQDQINDVERVLFTLDGRRPPEYKDSVSAALRDICSWNPKTDEFETDYMSGKVYKNGNAHITFKRLDLIDKANEIIAAFYGENKLADDKAA